MYTVSARVGDAGAIFLYEYVVSGLVLLVLALDQIPDSAPRRRTNSSRVVSVLPVFLSFLVAAASYRSIKGALACLAVRGD